MEEVPAGNMMEGIKLRIPIPIPFDFEGFLPLLFIIPSGQVNSFCQILVFCIEDSLMFFYLHIGACEKMVSRFDRFSIKIRAQTRNYMRIETRKAMRGDGSSRYLVLYHTRDEI